MVASPFPEVGFRLTQPASDVAVQAQALWVRTSMLARPPDGPIISDGAETVYRQGAPSCATSACCSPIAMVPFRRMGSAFALTRYAMVPSPCPSRPETISIHAVEVDDDQAHSRATVTFISPVPPAALKLGDELVIEAWQRVAVGPVTLVTALLPHPAVAAAMANRRARVRRLTGDRNTSCGPATIERRRCDT